MLVTCKCNGCGWQMKTDEEHASDIPEECGCGGTLVVCDGGPEEDPIFELTDAELDIVDYVVHSIIKFRGRNIVVNVEAR